MSIESSPLVSAVIITHNRCELLKRAVESAIGQTYQNMEVIVVDDASDDDTVKYGAFLKNMGVSYVRIEKKDSKGGNYARNIGIKRSAGKYVAFLDDDDYWLPEKTEQQVEYLENHSSVGMIFSGLKFEFKNSIYNYPRLPGKNVYGDLVKKQLYISPFCTTITMMVRKSILDEIGGFDENVRYWQEYELSLRIIQITEIAYINRCLSVANRDITVNRLTSQFESWEKTVQYINSKHASLFEKLTEDNKERKLEMYYKEAAYRASMSKNKKDMKKYYFLANSIRKKPEYVIRAYLGLSKNDTVLFETIIMKLLYALNKNRIGESFPK